MISGLTVIIAMAGMFITGDATFISFAIATVSVVAVAMFATLAVLPAVLAWLGDRVEKGRMPFSRRSRGAARESRFWGAVVTARDAPADRLDRRRRRPPGRSGDSGAADERRPDRVRTSCPAIIPVMKTYDRYTAAFPAKGNAVAVVVEADDVRSGEVAAGIEEPGRQADGLRACSSATRKSSTARTARSPAVAIPTQGKATDEQSMAALDEIRDELVPATVGEVEGATVRVTGGAAQSSDFADLLSERMPLVFAFVLGLAFLLMLVTFRSIVIPIKAIVLNLLSVGAAYGVLVLVFQNGLGEKLLGFESNGGITNWLPLFLFVILFGLSMDYHVFILTRVREAYDRGMSTEDAVRKGIAGSAGTVTGAAVVMVIVFSVFATLSFIDFKEMGVGLAVAILIDATIIRGVLLPATMKLLGDWNWCLPSRWSGCRSPKHESEAPLRRRARRSPRSPSGNPQPTRRAPSGARRVAQGAWVLVPRSNEIPGNPRLSHVGCGRSEWGRFRLMEPQAPVVGSGRHPASQSGGRRFDPASSIDSTSLSDAAYAGFRSVPGEHVSTWDLTQARPSRPERPHEDRGAQPDRGYVQPSQWGHCGQPSAGRGAQDEL